jgi:hypothetical protein
MDRVEETALDIKHSLHRNDIGNYYREGLWALLSGNEKSVIKKVFAAGDRGLHFETLSDEMLEALGNLENFSVLKSLKGKTFITAELLRIWLSRRLRHANSKSV